MSNEAQEMNMQDLAARAVETAVKNGAAESGAGTFRMRNVSLQWRNGKIETIKETTSRGLAMRLYVDGRYSANSTSDLRPAALETFIKNCLAMTRQLEPDPFRMLPDPALYSGRPNLDLKLFDGTIPSIKVEEKIEKLGKLEDEARSVKDAGKIISVTTGWEDTSGESFMVQSNGFTGGRLETGLSFWVETSVKGDGDKRPEDWSAAAAIFKSDLDSIKGIGQDASNRAMSILGAGKIGSGVFHVIVENRAAGRLASSILGGPLSGASLQQKRSYLEGMSGIKVASELLAVTDEPLVVKGFGSRLFDSEGISAKTLPLFEAGVLINYYIDTYYGKKLKLNPTTGSSSNLAWQLGSKSRDDLVRDITEGVLISSFLGGNSNDTTGDFSLGIRGFYIKDGKIVQPVAEMNMNGNHLKLWKNLVAVGNDPYPYSASRCPSLMFEGVSLSGT